MLLLEEAIAALRQASTLDSRSVETDKQWRTTVALAERQSDKKEEHLKEVARPEQTITRLIAPEAV